MKKILSFIFLIAIFSEINAQIDVNSSGNVGIGIVPSYKFDIYGSWVRFDYTRYPILIKLLNSDPRICSDQQIIFYKTDQSGYIDIKCKTVIENSDSACKKDIIPINEGLYKVKKLNGITFKWKEEKDDKRNAGFVAQEVEKIIPEAVYTVDSTNEKLLAYSHLIPYLVEAIKELSIQVDSLDNVIKEKNKLKSININNGLNKDNSLSNKAILYQNIPNPFSKETEISFYLSNEVNSALLNIYDMQGLQIKGYDLNEKGNSSVIINGSELLPGMYLYTLIADGQEIDTKRMILTSE